MTRRRRLHERLRDTRRSRGLTQADVAPALGVSRSTVAQLESGMRALKAEELGRLADLFGCSPTELLGRSERDGERGDGTEELVELVTAAAGLGDDESAARAVRGVLAATRELAALERLLGIEAVLNAPPVYTPSSLDSPWQAVHQGCRTAEDERRRLALGEIPIRFLDEHLATMGVRAATARLPDGIHAIFASRPELGPVVIASDRIGLGQRRVAFAHGLAHALFDGESPWRICRAEAGHDLREVRAHAFASAYLLPEHGVRRYLETLGKETLGRAGPAVFSLLAGGDGPTESGRALRVDGRTRKGRHPVTPADLARVAHYYGVDRMVTAYRMRNLRLLSDEEVEALLRPEAGGLARGPEATLPAPDHPHEMDALRSRIAALAAEARARGLIDDGEHTRLAASAETPEACPSGLLDTSRP
jgi:transcriptional regulator with XRE-family HTH domain